MGKRRRGFHKKQDVHLSVLDSDDDEFHKNGEPDPGSSEYIYDEVDNFHNRKEKILLEGGVPWKTDQRESTSEEEEVFSLDGSDNDDDDGKFARRDDDEADTDVDMTSDIEDKDDSLPNEKAWGKSKLVYYSTDYVDEDFGDFQGSDAEVAEEEEKIAMELQKKLAKELEDSDFGLDMFKIVEKSKEDESTAVVSEKVEKDLSKLSKREKLELLKKESPELTGIIDDFQFKMNDIQDRLGKLMFLINAGKIPPGPGAEYISTKYYLILHYCINVSFYLMMKARRVSIQSHPVISRMVNYKKLLKEAEEVDRQLEPEINAILTELEQTGDCKIIQASYEEVHPKKVKFSLETKKLSAIEVKKQGSTKQKDHTNVFETEDEKEALEMYDTLKKFRKRKNSKKEWDEEEGKNQAETDLDMKEVNPEEKRGITYEISKNKGLTPHRKKELRNPRVKHRMKFRKAKIRRRGQFREPKTELTRYGGETSGIKIGVRKSIKLK